MLPHQHAALGVLAYVLLSRWVPDTDRQVALLGAVVFGTQFPDLVDKPLAYYGVLPYGRSLMHSLLVVPLVVAGGVALARHIDHEGLGVAFGIGVVSHPLADSYHALLDGTLANAPYLLRPLLSIHEQPNPTAPWLRVAHIYASPSGLEVLLPALGGAILVLQRAPPVGWSDG